MLQQGDRVAIGAHVTMAGGPSRIIGVVRDSKHHTLNEDPFPYAYFPLLQFVRTRVGSPKLIVRTTGDAARLLPSVLAAVRAVDPNVPVFDETTMVDRLRSTLGPQLAGAWLLGVFSVLALVVAAVGIYGVVAYAVSRRTRELGIRMALGARGEGVVRLVVAANLGFVALGIPIGLILAVPLARTMTSFLYGVDAMDAPTLVGTSLVMLVVGVIASYIPARRIVRIDPLLALRADA